MIEIKCDWCHRNLDISSGEDLASCLCLRCRKKYHKTIKKKMEEAEGKKVKK
jgi:hypothetical protein